MQLPHLGAEQPAKEQQQWLSFNDEAVAKLQPQNIENACAYVLFYVRRD